LIKKQSAIQKSAKNKPKEQANFNQHKPKNKQPASLQKNAQIHKKTSPNSRENRKGGNTGVDVAGYKIEMAWGANGPYFGRAAEVERTGRCQAKFLTSAKFLTFYCFSVISLLRIKK